MRVCVLAVAVAMLLHRPSLWGRGATGRHGERKARGSSALRCAAIRIRAERGGEEQRDGARRAEESGEEQVTARGAE